MSGAKRTQGRWFVRAGKVLSDLGDGSAVALAEIETPYRPGVGLMRGEREAWANQHLLAAAPDLLAACEEAENWMDHHGDAENDEGAQMLLGILRAAIAKASGEVSR